MARRKLSSQQKARIANIQEKRRQKLAAKVESKLAETEGQEHRSGRVIVRHGQNVIIRDENNQQIHAMFRQNLGDVVCGDNVVWQSTADNEGVVVAVLDRDSSLSRPDYSGREKPLAANITRLIVVLAPEPEPTGYLLDQYLIAAELIGVEAVICLNKADLMTPEQQQAFHQQFSHYEKIGYPIIQISAKQHDGLEPLFEKLKDNTSILVGQSGVGKSSLINALIPQEHVEEGKLSEATGLGKHTTSAATLYRLNYGGEIIDSPGVRSFRLGKIDRRQLETGFHEFTDYLGQCRFHNCQHNAEPGCAIRAAVEAGTIHPDRLTNFLHMAQQLEH